MLNIQVKTLNNSTATIAFSILFIVFKCKITFQSVRDRFLVTISFIIAWILKGLDRERNGEESSRAFTDCGRLRDLTGGSVTFLGQLQRFRNPFLAWQSLRHWTAQVRERRAASTGRGFLVQCTCELAREHCATISGWDGHADHRPMRWRVTALRARLQEGTRRPSRARTRCTKAEINTPNAPNVPAKIFSLSRGRTDVAKIVRRLASPTPL